MPQVVKESQPKIIQALPEPLHSMKRFLLWKKVVVEGGRVLKTPYYANGRVRKGLLDTELDLSRLVTLDEAYDTFLLGGYTGIGFALANDGVGAFDVDKCLDDKGSLIKSHAGYELVLKAKKLGAYIEISPSGRGLRIVGPCPNLEAYSKDGLEYWGAKRFVTLTGDVWANPGGWVALDDLREALGVRPQAKGNKDLDDDEDGILVTPRTVEDLQSALEAIPSDERELWIRIGLALKTLGPKGKKLWLEWSAKSAKFDRGDAERVWGSMKPHGTHFRTIFHEAQNNWDWENPRSNKPRLVSENDDPETEDDDDDHPLPDQGPIDLGELTLYPTEFVLDGFIPASVSVIAGAWGAGKSTNLIPLFASVAHLAPEDWGFRPDLRRHIIWMSEAPEQARDTLYSLAKAPGSADWDEFKDWFHLFPAKRLQPKRLAKKIKELTEPLEWTTETGFRVKPVVVLDTTTANFDLENESDNSQVAAAMSILKQTLPGLPIVLVGHTPKAMVRADVGDMTFRGAGAWEAEAAATFFLVHDVETEMRFLAVRKARFRPSYHEVDFDFAGGSEIVETPWGDPQSKSYVHGVPTRSSGEARRAARDEAKEEREQERKDRAVSERQQKILEFVRKRTEKGQWTTRAEIRAGVTGNNTLLIEATDRLVEADLLVAYGLTQGQLDQKGISFAGRLPEILLLPGVDLDSFLSTVAKRKN
jgi:Primase C terminal 2 (PriCT-2)/AAA domain